MKKKLILLAAATALLCCGCGQKRTAEPGTPEALEENGVKVEYFEDTHYVSTLNGEFVSFPVANEDDAYRAVSEVAEMFGIKNAGEELKYDQTVSGRASTTYYFQQYYNGLKVVNGKISLFVDPDTNKVKYMNSSITANLSVETEASVSADAAAETVKQKYAVETDGAPALTVFDGDNANRLSWEILTKSDSPSVVYVDALTGDILYAVMPIGSAGNS